MDYENRYKEALDRAEKNYKTAQNLCEGSRIGVECFKNTLTNIFPELKESEDERVRKAIIEFFELQDDNTTYSLIPKKDILDWLEKQGEQKPTIDGILTATDYAKMFQNCKVNKFNIGDWIVFNGLVLHIDEVVDGYYRTTTIGGIPNSYDWAIDNVARLWSIEDAKPGDVLFKDLMGGMTFIFDGVDQEMAILYSFIISNDGGRIAHYNIGKPNTGIGYVEENKNIIHPATKEQRELLFSKMKESGYVFDAEKKELRKITQKPADIGEIKFHEGDILKHNKANIICKVLSANVGFYCLINILGGDEMELSNVEKNFHLWSIEDAQDGDVLVCDDDKRPFIFKGLLDPNHPNCPVAYCGIDSENLFLISTGIHWWTDEEVCPATKEQSDTLFARMKESGYEWDADKKELKELNPDNLIEESYQQQADDLIDMVTEKSSWSEEDDRIYYSLLADIRTRQDGGTNTLEAYYNEQIDWLKSIKNRLM